jgi:NAD(P)-dependent dehydrogenase (short-subunit alcohol dehydrogenase family)
VPSVKCMEIALITGASRGLGLALAQALADRGYGLAIDARGSDDLEAARVALARRTAVTAVAGDVADPAHREELVAAAARMGRLRLLVNNASVLGPSPQPDLDAYPLEVLDSVYRINVLAPLGLIQLALPALAAGGGTVLNITSDAAVENYPGWGGYGSSKAALEQLSNVLAAEHPGLRVYWADPGDMRTRMHQEAFPGEDISDRPLPETSVPGLLQLIEGDRPSGRYRAREQDRSEAAA